MNKALMMGMSFLIMTLHGLDKIAVKPQSTVDPIIRTFLNSLKGSEPIYKLSPDDARVVLEKVQLTPVTKLPAQFQDLTITQGDRKVSIRIVKPRGAKGTLPVILYMHGGGWVLGSAQTHDRLIRELANGTQAAVVFVNYSRAPEATYPTAHEEGYAVAEWLVKNGKKYNLDASNMVIAGDSVGGLMATAIALMAAERKGPHFRFQLLMYPVTDANFHTESYKKFATGYFLEREGMKWFWNSYVPDEKQRLEPYAAPLRASKKQLRLLPPAYVIVGENDVLRSEVEAYTHAMMNAGIPVVGKRYLGLTHDFAMLNPITHTPGIRAAIADVILALKNALKK